MLERLDPAPEFLEGKKGACVGTFQVRSRNPDVSLGRVQFNIIFISRSRHSIHGPVCSSSQAIVAGKESKDSLRDIVAMLRSNSSNPQIDGIVRVMRAWAKDNGVHC